jgi:predicted nucleic acid-binding protein
MPMRVDCFLDTNILIYAALGREAEETKRAKAAELILTTNFGLSAQVLQEFYATVIRKPDRSLIPAVAYEWIEELEQQPCAAIDKALVKVAIATSWQHQISYWDAAIIAAAERLGAETLFTEDLNHGQTFGAVRVVNPFIGG